MKKVLAYSTLLISVFFLHSCGEPEDVLDLNFKLEYDDSPVVMFQDFMYPNGKLIQLQRVSFYLSDIAVQNSEGMDVLISEAEYIDLTDSHLTEASAADGFNYKKENISAEEYSSISFNIGLTEEQNSMAPEDFTSSSPLSISEEYWRNWNSYVFFKIEGKYDFDGDGAFGAGEAFALHIGTDESRRSFSASTSDTETDITIDLNNIFVNNGETYDLDANSRLHSLTPEVLAAMDFLATGIGQAVTVE